VERDVERSGLSIEFKIVLLVVAALIVQDLLLLAMHLAGASPLAIQTVLGGVLILALILAAVWGNAVARAVRRLTRACYVARRGDTSVLFELTRTDEIGQLNAEINQLVALVRTITEERDEAAEAADVVGTVERVAPELLRSSHELLVSLKELKEGAAAEIDLTRRIAGRLAEVRAHLAQITGGTPAPGAASDMAARLGSLPSLSREIELLSDVILDEASRGDIDEAALARAVNGVRDAARTLSEVSAQAVSPLSRRDADREAAERALEGLDAALEARADATRVAELMGRSVRSGIGEGGRLASALKRLGVTLESYGRRGRVR
jgi:methyl-accepting chemotaxis protein